MDEIIFVINEKERIRMSLPCKVDAIFRYDLIEAEYIYDDVCKYVIYSDDDFSEFIDVLSVALKRSLTGCGKLDESLQENLGYGWNTYLDKSTNAPEGQQPPRWIGARYLLWETQALDMWLYEREGKIFFEITPGYRWHYREPEPEAEGYITFGEFIKNYYPCVIAELSMDAVREWLKQVEYLQALVKVNHEKYRDPAS